MRATYFLPGKAVEYRYVLEQSAKSSSVVAGDNKSVRAYKRWSCFQGRLEIQPSREVRANEDLKPGPAPGFSFRLAPQQVYKLSGFTPISLKELAKDSSRTISPVVDAAWLMPTVLYFIFCPASICFKMDLALAPPATV